MRRRTHKNSRSDRRGVQVLLFLLIFPLLVIITMAIIEFCAMVVVRDAVLTAANEAAREASKVYDFTDTARTELIVEEVVNEILSVHGVMIGPGVRVLVEDFDNGQFIDLGDMSLTPTPSPVVLAEDELRVVVLVNCDVTPVPNVLATFGLDVSGGLFESSSIAIYQQPPLD